VRSCGIRRTVTRRTMWKLCDEERGRSESEKKVVYKQYKINKVKMGYQESVEIFVFALVSSPTPCSQSHKSWYYSLYVIKDTNLMCSQISFNTIVKIQQERCTYYQIHIRLCIPLFGHTTSIRGYVPCLVNRGYNLKFILHLGAASTA
jgi:hypothetical protein